MCNLKDIWCQTLNLPLGPMTAITSPPHSEPLTLHRISFSPIETEICLNVRLFTLSLATREVHLAIWCTKQI